ncbi:MAG: hypothetical protein WBN04_05495, partial [Paracoccaceae bacterium]
MPVISSDRTRPGTWRHIARIAIAPLMALGVGAIGAMAEAQSTLAEQRLQYDAVRAKSIIELQPFRHEMSASLPDSDQTVRLISLNPAINSWFLLQIGKEGADKQTSYHIENPDPTGQKITLAPGPALGITGTSAMQCAPWSGDPSPLGAAAASGLSYAPICDGRLYLRNPSTGSATSLERTTQFLRDHVWQGEELVRFVRDNFFRDAFA